MQHLLVLVKLQFLVEVVAFFVVVVVHLELGQGIDLTLALFSVFVAVVEVGTGMDMGMVVLLFVACLLDHVGLFVVGMGMDMGMGDMDKVDMGKDMACKLVAGLAFLVLVEVDICIPVVALGRVDMDFVVTLPLLLPPLPRIHLMFLRLHFALVFVVVEHSLVELSFPFLLLHMDQ